MQTNLTYAAQEVYIHDRAHFLGSLFLPEQQREIMLCFYALNLELARIPSVVSEEMIGHIRYAWWQEAIESLYKKGEARGQPLLLSIAHAHAPKEPLLALVAAYSDAFPQAPATPVSDIAATLVQSVIPDSQARWLKINRIIERHRMRHGTKRNGWLSFKLLIS